MAADPDTVKIIQIVHDTLHTTVRDTVVRVAEPYHDPEKANWFFGKMYPVDLIVGAIALLNAGYTAYVSFIERARVTLKLGDHVGIVLNPGDVGRKLHLRCNFVNSAAKMGAVQHLEAEVAGPQGVVARFRWHLFYEYREGGNLVDKIADVYPLAVAGRDSHLQFIELDVVELPPGERPRWTEGRYTLKVEGWINKAKRDDHPNLLTTCHFTIHAEGARLLQTGQPAQPNFIPFLVEEWAAPQS
jgi:hypothetical protein